MKNKIKYCWNCKSEVPYQTYGLINYIPTCSHCGVMYPEKPKDEAKLSIYQDEYLKTRSDESFNKLFALMSDVTFNVICHKLKSKGSYEKNDDIWDKVQWTLEKITSYYKEKPDFKINTSFIQYIGQVVLFPIYNKEEQEREKKEISLYSSKYKSPNGSKEKELLDYLQKDDDEQGISEVEFKLDYDSNKNTLIEKSISFVSDSINELYKYERMKNNNKEFKYSFYLAELYNLFICGKMEDRNVKDILDSLDSNLVKKFNDCVGLYKEVLVNYARES